jgi:hypothetical protein
MGAIAQGLHFPWVLGNGFWPHHAVMLRERRVPLERRGSFKRSGRDPVGQGH